MKVFIWLNYKAEYTRIYTYYIELNCVASLSGLSMHLRNDLKPIFDELGNDGVQTVGTCRPDI